MNSVITPTLQRLAKGQEAHTVDALEQILTGFQKLTDVNPSFAYTTIAELLAGINK